MRESDGFCPFALDTSGDKTGSIQQGVTFHFGRTKNDVHQALENDKHWHGYFTGKTGGNVDIVYDNKRMYASTGGVRVSVKGDGKDGVTASDDGNGRVSVNVGEAAEGKNFEVVLEPKNA